ncbi:hypothetical protein H3H32_10650 [Spirosoma foliorum]|uniref:Uncharacterized protein n=2 Tax=Spirosoma foliorum TaxID=2710596 RepID=A0A7G5H2F9_9BACT|nr:hypothetical protein H3H32_10650 [Spirosoma foliorum]
MEKRVEDQSLGILPSIEEIRYFFDEQLGDVISVNEDVSPIHEGVCMLNMKVLIEYGIDLVNLYDESKASGIPISSMFWESKGIEFWFSRRKAN